MGNCIEWKDIEGCNGRYQINQFGDIKNSNGRLMSTWKTSKGYISVTLQVDKQKRNFRINRLVAQTFIPNPENKPCVDHINGIKTDNRVENLRWVTYSENNNNPNTKQRFYNMMWNTKKETN